MKRILFWILDNIPDRVEFKRFIDDFFSRKSISIIVAVATLGNLLFNIYANFSDIYEWVTGGETIKPPTFQEILKEIQHIILTVLVIIVVFLAVSFIKKWNEVVDKNIQLNKFSNYQSVLVQDTIIHLSHIEKTNKNHNNILQVIKESESKFDKSMLSLFEGYPLDPRVEQELAELSLELFVDNLSLSVKVVEIYDKAICKGFKRFLKDIFQRNEEAIFLLTGLRVETSLSLYTEDFPKSPLLYTAFVDDKTYFSGSSLKGNVFNIDFLGKDSSKEFNGLEGRISQKDNHHIVELTSNNIINEESPKFGFIKYTFSESIENNQNIDTVLKPMHTTLSELISYNLEVMRNNMNKVRQDVYLGNEEEFNFLDIVYKHFK